VSDSAAQTAAETTTPPGETTTPAPASPSEAQPPSSLLGDVAPEAESAPPPDPFDPETIKFPDGVTREEALFNDFTDIAKEHGLTGPAAQRLIDLAAKQLATATQRQQAVWEQQNAEWQAQIKADKEIGGDKLPGTLQTFAKVASNPELSDPAFREALAATGAGNHPAIVRTLARWAKALSEGGPIQGGPAGSSRTPQTLGEVFYGTGSRNGAASS